MSAEYDNRQDRMEQHLRLIKEDVQYITTALIGSGMNGNRGIITDISSIKKDLEEIEKKVNVIEIESSKKDVYINQLRFIAGALIIGIISILVSFYSKS